VPFAAVHRIDSANDIGAECTRYEALLRAKTIDIVCLGIGENGHIAFNDPPVADFQDKVWVKPVDLDDACRRQQVNDGCFSTLEDVPTHALTLTIPALMSGKHLFSMVPGPTEKLYAEEGVPDNWKLLRYDVGHLETADMRDEIVSFLKSRL
jgi:glucosamine-6-phosphate deaminase